MTWGFNFGSNSLSLATTELNAILSAFSTSTSNGGVSGSGVTLKFVELGNEPDLYGNNGHRDSGYSVSDYVTKFVVVSFLRVISLIQILQLDPIHLVTPHIDLPRFSLSSQDPSSLTR